MKPLLRRRTQRDHRVVHQVASWCLGYPDDGLLECLPLLTAALGEQDEHESVRAVRTVIADLAAADPDELRHDYIDTFDLSRKQTLYLTYWSDGDTRRRGTALTTIKQLYRDSGFLVDLNGELPDHLPIVLEYCARADPERGRELLAEHRPALESIRTALAERGSRYEPILAAICATVPVARASARPADIPVESVGLEPYDPRLLPLSPTQRVRPPRTSVLP
ncbi:nitrate reductase molybdenum cofactor assembly chaperone [Gordonia sp. DT219]|uniref:nitrate reductase molybdenum cofactor assembly chaperone n=1 Tax=Gordonia sp. DT219 TaxID=3416658 RepID=UPI003CEC7034